MERFNGIGYTALIHVLSFILGIGLFLHGCELLFDKGNYSYGLLQLVSGIVMVSSYYINSELGTELDKAIKQQNK